MVYLCDVEIYDFVSSASGVFEKNNSFNLLVMNEVIVVVY